MGVLFACLSEKKFHIAGIDLKFATSMRLVPNPDPLVPTFQSAGFTSMYHHIQLCAHLKTVSLVATQNRGSRDKRLVGRDLLKSP